MPLQLDTADLMPEVAALTACVNSTGQALTLEQAGFDVARSTLLSLAAEAREVAANQVITLTVRVGTSGSGPLSWQPVLQAFSELAATLKSPNPAEQDAFQKAAPATAAATVEPGTPLPQAGADKLWS